MRREYRVVGPGPARMDSGLRERGMRGQGECRGWVRA